MRRPTAIWTRRYDLFGVPMNAVNYRQAEDLIIAAAKHGESRIVTHLPVHGVVTAFLDRTYRSHISGFDLIAPDGQPVRWALNWFHGAALSDRVYGPELMMRLCRRAAREGVGVYLYGSLPEVVQRLQANLLQQCPGLKLVGAESPPFRPLTHEERKATVRRIRESGAGMLFIGLGCPRQDLFASENRDSLPLVQVCVGAAFDFHAGNKRMAPPWMQRRGLEWLFRLIQEPRRLWRRYLGTNSVFVLLAALHLLRHPALVLRVSRI